MRANKNKFRTGPSSLGAGAAVSEDGSCNLELAQAPSHSEGELVTRIATNASGCSPFTIARTESPCWDSYFGDDFPAISPAIISRRNFSRQNHSQDLRRFARPVHSNWGK